MPVVSVIIPTYNNKKLLTEAIDSVLSQSMPDFELLVIDDGSTDGTGELVKAIKDSRIRYFYKENGGVSSARNVGIRQAQGEYIAFLDSDDLYGFKHLKTMVSALEKNPDYGVAYTSANMEYPDGRTVERWNEKYCRSGWVTQNLFCHFFVLCQTSLIRRCFMESVCFDETLALAEDKDVFLKLSLLTKFLYVPQSRVIRRMQYNSLARVNGKGKVGMDNIIVPERFYFENCSNQWISRRQAFLYLSEEYLKMGRKLLRQGEINSSLYCFKKSLRYRKTKLRVLIGLLRCFWSKLHQTREY